ncbi:MAG: PD40 domain-containing protein [candidate division Zixibacteria bacterium]|nr:PD40 domain-containing protein [candidate division Zixibacteria bacterium]
MKSIFVLTVTLLTLVCSSGCSQDAGAESAIRKRWASGAHGRIAFISGIYLGRQERALCVMDVSTGEVSTVLSGDSVRTDVMTSPQWSRDHRMIVFSTVSNGVYQYDIQSGVAKRVSFGDPGQQVLFDSGEATRTRKVGNRLSDSVPVARHSIESIALGKATGRLYTVWLTGQEGLGHLTATVRDSVGSESTVVGFDGGIFCGFAVSPDEKRVVFSTEGQFRLWDIARSTWLMPNRPADYHNLFGPSFSPDGQSLAVVGRGGTSPSTAVSGILISHAPGFSEWQELRRLSPNYFPFSLCWSPDGKWLLVTVQRRGGGALTISDLLVVDAKTGMSFELDKVFLRGGHPVSGIYVDGGMDWTE